ELHVGHVGGYRDSANCARPHLHCSSVSVHTCHLLLATFRAPCRGGHLPNGPRLGEHREPAGMTTSSAPSGDAGPLVVLAAMPEEAAALLARLTGPQPVPVPLAGATAESGHLSGTQTVVVTTGIGIAAATAAATWAILEHR